MSHHTTAPATIDLAAPRTIVLQGRERSFTLTCRRITAEDWREYFDAICIASRQDGRDQERTLDLETPRRTLAERVIVAASGYDVDGGAALETLPDWQKKLPLSHRLKVGEVLGSARAVSRNDDDLTIYPEGEPVFLDTVWTVGENGAMQGFSGLKHILATPTEAQYRRYAREASRTRILGGSRTGTTIYPGAQGVLAELYDELIVSVEGYGLGGQPLSGREQIAREMDMQHKVAAAQEIFQPRQDVTTK